MVARRQAHHKRLEQLAILDRQHQPRSKQAGDSGCLERALCLVLDRDTSSAGSR